MTLTAAGLGTTYEWVAKVAGLSIGGSNVFTEFVPNRSITDRCSRAFEGTCEPVMAELQASLATH